MKCTVTAMVLTALLFGVESHLNATIVYSGIQDLGIAERSQGERSIRLFDSIGQVPEIVIFDRRREASWVLNIRAGEVDEFGLYLRGSRTVAEGLDEGEIIQEAIEPEYLEWMRFDQPEFPYWIGHYYPEHSQMFVGRENRYMGFKLDSDNEQLYFGWLRMSHFEDQERFVIHDWAYQSEAGEAIYTGEIPEPGAVGKILGIGALLYVLVRRRSHLISCAKRG